MNRISLSFLILALFFGELFGQSALLPNKVVVLESAANNSISLLSDRDSITYFKASGNKTTFVFQYSVPIKASYYSITPANNDAINDPTDWTIYGSVDNKQWRVIDKKKENIFHSRFQKKAFEIESPEAYAFYKFELKSAKKTSLSLAEVSLYGEEFPKKKWENFIYPEVNFSNKDESVNGSQIYHSLINQPADFIADHAQEVASILYWTDEDERMDVREINYELRPDKGISAKSGQPPVINIFYSADWVEKTAVSKSEADVLYETRGVLYHELTHAYQFCPKGAGEYRSGDEYFAFIEGLADAVRFEAGFFPISSRKPGGNWMDGYRTTGFFLHWLKSKDSDFLRKFNRSAVDINPWSFDSAIKDILGSEYSTDGLWAEYQDYLQDYEFITKVKTNVVDHVNTLMGTDSKISMSNGNTYPAIALPWGMNFWTPQTGKMGHGWAYTYDADKIRGFKQTHQPSPWINDYGQFSIMPVTGQLKIDEDSRASWFSHKAETAKPYYYSVYLADHDVVTEITPTERSAYFRFTFPENDSSFVIIDAFDRGSYIKVIPEENKIIGYTTRNSGGVPQNFKNYFIVEFDQPFETSRVWNKYEVKDGLSELKDEHVGVAVSFKTKKGQKITARVTSSFIDYEQAARNMEEIGLMSFDQVKESGRQRWNDVLGKIAVDGDNIDQIRTFYSAMYRTVLFPRMFYEFDKNGNPVHYSPYHGEVKPGYLFTDTGFWDTFRSLFPFINLVFPSMAEKMQKGLLNTYLESGFYPEWASPGHRSCMVGNNSASVVADAYMKGHINDNAEKMYEGLQWGANNVHPSVRSTGRYGYNYYNDIGYIPYDVRINESVARTLEYAYDDWCIYQMGKKLGRPQEELAVHLKNSRNYKNVFDKESKLMRGRNYDGTFQSPFNPFKWGDAFTEGNSWHYTWSVFHDIQGLMDLMGGKESFVGMLDSVFNLPPVFDESYYGGVIHEIREMQIMNMGNYAHGNQPIQHMIYLYDYAGASYKTQYWVREAMDRLYFATPDGYCGDEDNGQTSAWYVFSAMGFYPVCPGSDQYVLGAPLFKKVILSLENGNKVEISAPQNSSSKRYINKVSYNGSDYTKNYFEYPSLQKGADIKFDMTDQPNKGRATEKEDLPYSLTNEL